MSKGQRIVTIALWAVLVVVMLGVIGAGAWDRIHDGKPTHRSGEPATKPGTSELQVLWSVPAFSLTDQDGKTVTDQSLRGHPWVATFIFTNCAGPCPMITGKMAHLQETIQNRAVHFVSFTVDPERDTPEVLRGYAKAFSADTSRWRFLTGTRAAMDQVARDMKVASQHADGSQEIEHGTQILLIDADGRLRGIYRGQSEDPAEMKRLAQDADLLAAAAPAPAAGSKPQ
jgi:cytochrome oxidase Cu insertion factor (SCO1/SenC/PrrC family)